MTNEAKKKETVRPLNDRVFVRIEDDETTTPGGLHIPESARDISTYARVVAVGPGKRLEDGTRRKPIVEPGMKIVIGKFSRPILLDFNDERDKHLFLREDEIDGWCEESGTERGK